LSLVFDFVVVLSKSSIYAVNFAEVFGEQFSQFIMEEGSRQRQLDKIVSDNARKVCQDNQ
jgi:hypothetical protein